MNVVQLVSNKVWGGGERYVLDLSRRLSADGHSVAVITRCYKAVDEPFEKVGFHPGHLPLGGVFDFVSASRLSHVLDNMAAPVVVHCHNFKDARTATRARRMMREPDKVRIVVTRHLVKPGRNDSTSRALYADIDAIAFVSQTAMDAFVSGCPGVDGSRLSVIYNGLAPVEDIVPLPRNGEALRLVYAGRLSPEKGVERLIESMPSMPAGAVLHIAGSGRANYEVALRRYAKAAGVDDRIVWHGHMSDPAPLMASADIGVVPTVAQEAFGLTVLEFMQLGVPVIVTNNGGPAEIITNGRDGLLVAPDDARSLAAAVNRLATDETLRRSMGEAARRTSQRFDYDTFYKKILHLYQ